MLHPWTRRALVLLATSIPAAGAALAPGCGSTSVENDAGADAGADAPDPVVTVLHPDAPPLDGESECVVTVTTGIPVTKAFHVELCSHVDYPTNPPSGGNHWPVWAAYTTYDVAVPREMYVHNLEHGSILFLYKCDDACPAVLAALAEIRAGLPGDPLCTQPDGPIVRAVTTPDPLLDRPIALATWGATYTATCIDKDSLRAFAKAHYGKGTEATCAQGKLYGTPDSGAPTCTGSGGSGGTGGSGGGSTSSGGTGGLSPDAGDGG